MHIPPTTYSNAFIFQYAKINRLYNETRETPLHNYQIGRNIIGEPAYIIAEVHADSLDKGADPTSDAIRSAKVIGTLPGDEACQYIPKQLGGCGLARNMFPLNPVIDISAWKQAEQRVYDHVAKGSNKHALLVYAIECNEEMDEEGRIPEIARPSKLHYYFKLFENNEFTGQAIEGCVVNTSPAVTNPNFYH